MNNINVTINGSLINDVIFGKNGVAFKITYKNYNMASKITNDMFITCIVYKKEQMICQKLKDRWHRNMAVYICGRMEKDMINVKRLDILTKTLQQIVND